MTSADRDAAWTSAVIAAARPQAIAALLALLPRPRHGRGGVPGGVPARADGLAAERAAAQCRRLADHGRAQRRHRRRAAAQPAGADAARGACLGPVRRRDAAGGSDRRGGLPRRHTAAPVHLLPSRAAGDPADRAGAAHRLGPVGPADRPRLPGRRGGDGAAHHAGQGADRARRRALRDAGPGRAGRAPRGGGGDGLPRLQRGLFDGRRGERGAGAPLPRGDSPRPASAAALPDRARADGARRADAAAARARRGAVRRLGRRDSARGSGPGAVGRPDDRRGRGAGRQGDAPPPAGPLPDPGGDRGAARARPTAGGDRLGARSISSTARSSGCSHRPWSR